MDSNRTHVFAHVDAPLAALYRRVMGVFVQNKARFVVHLRPEDVIESLRSAQPGDDAGHEAGHEAGQDAARPAGHEAVTEDAVEKALRSLEEWGNLRADPDASRVTTVEDFYRPRYLYQLSREGEAAERALEVFEREIGRRGELQAIALEDIRVRLRALWALSQEPSPDPAVVHNLLLELANRLDSLAANAGAFMGSLQRTIDLQEVDEDAFLAYKDRLIAYLERFVSDLVVKAHDIATTLRSLQPERVDALLALAAEREAGDVAPDAEAAAADGPSALELKLADWQRRWSGLWSWFGGDRLHPSQATLLRQRARKAIPDLLATISLLQDRRSGRSDRSADFRELARWFAQAPTEEDAHRLWRAAFGLSTSRHLTGAIAGEDLPPGTSWLEAPPVTIAARLRATGHYQRRGKATQVADRSAERARLAELITAERAQADRARARFATGRPALLSELGELDREEFALLLRLLSEALSAGPPGPDGQIRTMTADGALLLTLTPVPAAAPVQIRTGDGVLHAPEHELTVTDRSAAAAPGPVLDLGAVAVAEGSVR